MTSLTTNKHLDSFMQANLVTDANRRMQLVTNEQSQMDMRQANERSFCCNGSVIHDGLHTFCFQCGEPCLSK